VIACISVLHGRVAVLLIDAADARYCPPLAMLELVCLHRRAAWRPLFDCVDSPGLMAPPNLPDKGDQVDRMNRVPRNLVNFAEDQSAR
jgi:hypothetical protein